MPPTAAVVLAGFILAKAEAARQLIGVTPR
jgi:hypothetical protein